MQFINISLFTFTIFVYLGFWLIGVDWKSKNDVGLGPIPPSHT